MRILAINDAVDLVTVFYEDGSKVEYGTWEEFIDKVDLDNVETYMDIFGDWWHHNGVAPLTAYPVQGSTVRPAGQGCKRCRYFRGCLATEKYRGNLRYVTERTGTSCTSWVQGLGI